VAGKEDVSKRKMTGPACSSTTEEGKERSRKKAMGIKPIYPIEERRHLQFPIKNG